MNNKLIKLNLTGGIPGRYLIAFEHAANRINRIVYPQNPGENNQLSIQVTVKDIDGPGAVLGQAGPICGPTKCRTSDGLPVAGIMEFDAADLDQMLQDESLFDVILHEMLHVCGFGTIWYEKNLLHGGGTDEPLYVGWYGLTEYRRLAMNSQLQGVPVEGDGGPGTSDSHWDEDVFQHEIGTGYISGIVRPLSRLTIASLADLGYKVDFSQADPYVLPNTSLSALVMENKLKYEHPTRPKIEYIDDLKPEFVAA